MNSRSTNLFIINVNLTSQTVYKRDSQKQSQSSMAVAPVTRTVPRLADTCQNVRAKPRTIIAQADINIGRRPANIKLDRRTA